MRVTAVDDGYGSSDSEFRAIAASLQEEKLIPSCGAGCSLVLASAKLGGRRRETPHCPAEDRSWCLFNHICDMWTHCLPAALEIELTLASRQAIQGSK